MITGEIRSKVDKVWEAFWSGGVSNPLSVIEQITYLLFVKRLDDLHTAREKKSNLTGKPIEDPIFSESQDHLRWTRFRELEAGQMFELYRDEVFPFMKDLGGTSESTYSRFMKDAVFSVPTASLLERVVTMIGEIPMEDRDTKGDLYEYMLGKIASAGQNGQFRTPRHIIKMMVELMQPTPTDRIADPACGTCGFLVAAAEYMQDNHEDMFTSAEGREHFSRGMFHGSDFDSTMLRIGAMNMMLHGIENPNIVDVDALSEDAAQTRQAYSLILANPPFKGSLNYDETAPDLLQVAKTKKTELLFLSLFLGQLEAGGRCACIVPDGVLFGSSKAHKAIRQELIEGQRLEGVIDMPSGVFKPYAGVSTAILIFTKTDSGGTDNVWFYRMEADGYSLDDKRTEVEANDIPDLLEKWSQRGTLDGTDRKGKFFAVPKAEIAENDYDLSTNRYREIEYEAVEYDPPQEILQRLAKIEEEIAQGRKDLEGMLG